jgi:hypothetical protein
VQEVGSVRETLRAQRFGGTVQGVAPGAADDGLPGLGLRERDEAAQGAFRVGDGGVDEDA